MKLNKIATIINIFFCIIISAGLLAFIQDVFYKILFIGIAIASIIIGIFYSKIIKVYGLVVVIVCLSISINENKKTLYPFLYESVNVNINQTTEDILWYSPENLDYNDMILPLILKNNVCVTTYDCWFKDYLKVFSKDVVFVESIPIYDKTEFTNLGVGYIVFKYYIG